MFTLLEAMCIVKLLSSLEHVTMFMDCTANTSQLVGGLECTGSHLEQRINTWKTRDWNGNVSGCTSMRFIHITLTQCFKEPLVAAKAKHA